MMRMADGQFREASGQGESSSHGGVATVVAREKVVLRVSYGFVGALWPRPTVGQWHGGAEGTRGRENVAIVCFLL